jgi:hypothetical protein
MSRAGLLVCGLGALLGGCGDGSESQTSMQYHCLTSIVIVIEIGDTVVDTSVCSEYEMSPISVESFEDICKTGGDDPLGVWTEGALCNVESGMRGCVRTVATLGVFKTGL